MPNSKRVSCAFFNFFSFRHGRTHHQGSYLALHRRLRVLDSQCRRKHDLVRAALSTIADRRIPPEGAEQRPRAPGF